MADPMAVFSQFMDRQQRGDQFTQDIHKVMFPGGSDSSCPSRTRALTGAAQPMQSATRTRSPGLAAGAALALGGSSSAADVHADAHAARRRAVEYARKRDCPFDDHSMFAEGVAEIPHRSQHVPPLAPGDARLAHQAANSIGRHNRDLQQKIGAGSPFDAPECGPVKSSSAAMSAAVAAGQPQAYVEAQAEALCNKSRMTSGAQDLLAGNYLLGNSSAVRRNNSLPPRPGDGLLPQAHMKLQYEGGSANSCTNEKMAYLNSKVLAENNRERNEFRRMFR